MKKINAVMFVLCAVLNLQAQANQKVPKWVANDLTEMNVFTEGVEGPAVDKHGNLYAVNFAKQGTIGIVNAVGEAKHFVELPNDSIGNGIRFGANGIMFVADYINHNVLRVDMSDLTVSVYAHNENMNQPNDIAISRNGVIYASDPNWADNTGQLWMVDKDKKVTLLDSDMGTTNGIEISSDEKTLYVGESVQQKIWAYDISLDGTVANKRLFHEFSEHGLDGMRVDTNGNLFVARYGAGTVAVLTKQGELVREIELNGDFPTNVAFGGKDGKTVYVTMKKRGAIEYFRTDSPGRAFGFATDD